MQDYPHHYSATARAGSEGAVAVSSKGLADLETAPPAEFGGPGDRWSPETLLVGAVADCFILTFRAVARASQLEWLSLECEAVGTLERVEKVVQFSAIHVRAALRVPAGTDPDRAKRLLERAEKSCLVTNSFKAATSIEAAVEVEAEA